MNPEDRGPSSERVVKLNLANPIHVGIVKNKENNPNVKIRHTEKGAILSMAVAPGMEFEPKLSTKYPSFNTETTPYKYEAPKVKEAPKKEAAKPKKPELQTESQKAVSKEELRRRADAVRNARLAALKKK